MKKNLALLTLLWLALACNTVGIAGRDRGYGFVSPQIAWTMIQDSREVVVVDVRPAAAFQEPPGHVGGAISAPISSIEARLPELVPYTRDTVLVYGSSNEEAEAAALVFVAAGFRSVTIINGGIDRWIELKYPNVSSN